MVIVYPISNKRNVLNSIQKHTVSFSHTISAECLCLRLWRNAVLSQNNKILLLHWSQTVYFRCLTWLCSAVAAVIPVFTKSLSCWELCSVQRHWAVYFSLYWLYSEMWKCASGNLPFELTLYNCITQYSNSIYLFDMT